jgi:hypothetical protein
MADPFEDSQRWFSHGHKSLNADLNMPLKVKQNADEDQELGVRQWAKAAQAAGVSPRPKLTLGSIVLSFVSSTNSSRVAVRRIDRRVESFAMRVARLLSKTDH